MQPVTRKQPSQPLRRANRLVLSNVALTGSPSNKEALVIVARSINTTAGGPVAEPVSVDESVARQIEDKLRAEFEATQRAKDERIAALEADKARRDEEVARTECKAIAAEFKGVGAAGVDLGDLVYRARKADPKIEADLIAVLRAANARAKAGTEALVRSVGHNGEDDSAIPAELVGIVTPKHMADANGDIMRAVLAATEDAKKAGNNANYQILRSYKVS